jgi:hypothetical protein
MDRLDLSELVGEQGRHPERQEHPGAGMEQPPQSRPGKAAPRALHVRLTEGVLSSRGTQASSRPSPRRGRCEAQATARRPRPMAAPPG